MEIKNTEVWGFEHAFRGMRNPMNSWSKSDSFDCVKGLTELDGHCSTYCKRFQTEDCYMYGKNDTSSFIIGDADLKLAQTLIRSGNEHCKFMRMIHVSADFDMPRYWWSEEDTYHFNTKNSCSTMHKLLNNNNPITLDMFVTCEEDNDVWGIIVERLEKLRQEYKAIQKTTKNPEQMNRLLVRAKRLLSEGFLQMRTVDTNYAELRTEYFQRRNHRLKEEWVDVWCKWIESLPYAKELITYEPSKP